MIIRSRIAARVRHQMLAVRTGDVGGADKAWPTRRHSNPASGPVDEQGDQLLGRRERAMVPDQPRLRRVDIALDNTNRSPGGGDDVSDPFLRHVSLPARMPRLQSPPRETRPTSRRRAVHARCRGRRRRHRQGVDIPGAGFTGEKADALLEFRLVGDVDDARTRQGRPSRDRQ